MVENEIQTALNALANLSANRSSLSPREVESLLECAITPLLQQQGYHLEHRVPDDGIDFYAERPPTDDLAAHRIAIQLKHRSSIVGVGEVRMLIGSAMLADVDRAILISSSNFSHDARWIVERQLPMRVELLGFDDLEIWAKALGETKTSVGAAVSLAFKSLHRELALLIATDPDALKHVEWFDVERIAAEIFDGLGFSVTLTPPSKDGGKDVILQFAVSNKSVEYYVEVKHWRSRTKVGSSAVQDFVKVVVQERKEGGLFLSTHGFATNAFEQLSEIDRERVKFGDCEKIITLCKTYSRAQAGLWSPPMNLVEILYEQTL